MEFQMTKPTGYGAIIAMVAIVTLLVCTCVFLVVLFISARSYTLRITGGSLDIQSVFYNTHLKLSDVQTENIHFVDYDSLGITLRTNGMSFPGVEIGWHRGKGKKYKAYVTDKKHVILIPTRKNYDILFSTTDGDKIIREMRNQA